MEKDAAIKSIGENIMKFLFANNFQLMETDPRIQGFFAWYERFQKLPRQIFTDDCGNAGLVLLNFYRITKNNEYLNRAQALGDAFLRIMNPEKGFVTCFDARGALENGFDWLLENTCTLNPHHIAHGMIFLLELSRITGEDKYKDKTLQVFETLQKVFPDIKMNSSFSDPGPYSRYLGLLIAVHEIAGRDLSSEINKMLVWFKQRQHACGGIYETGGKGSGIEAGVFIIEAGVFMKDEDFIADNLYTNNFLANYLAAIPLMKNPGDINLELAADIQTGLRKYFIKTQIQSPDSKLNGAWIRAFDMEKQEYYGLNLDKDWGPYCIETGWTMTYIPVAFLMEKMKYSIFFR